jgi:hypothetical protein
VDHTLLDQAGFAKIEQQAGVGAPELAVVKQLCEMFGGKTCTKSFEFSDELAFDHDVGLEGVGDMTSVNQIPPGF